MIDMKCPQCGKELHIDEKYAGKAGRCQHCQQKITVPHGNDWQEIESQHPTSGKGLASVAPPKLPKRKGMPRPLEVFFIVVGMITCVGAVGVAGLFMLGIALVAQSPEIQEALEAIEGGPTQTTPASILAAKEPPETSNRKSPTPKGPASLFEFNLVESQIREFAAREYPNDSRMQKYVYDRQLAGMRYMTTVTDQEVRQIALREYRTDYSMQKYVYDRQFSAKRYMTTVTDQEARQIALREYPNDYSMQEYVYNRALSRR